MLVVTRFGRLSVRRERPARFSLGVDNEIILVLENHSAVRLTLIVRDQIPTGFRADPIQLSGGVFAYGQGRLSYRLLPTQRGDFSFGDVSVRCHGPLGLAFVDHRLPAGEAVQVYPNLLEVRRYEAMLRTTLVRAGGYRPKRMPGAGREFSHYRDYTPDDDFRHVSWKATARRNKPITAVFESEHSQDLIFCLDIGRMMAARVGALTKLDHAINAVLMLTHVSQTFQDNLGLLVFSTKSIFICRRPRPVLNTPVSLSALFHPTGVLLCQLSGSIQHADCAVIPTTADNGVTYLLDATASKEYLGKRRPCCGVSICR